MKHLFVMDPLASVNPAGDTSFDFMVEAQSRGDELYVCAISDIVVRGASGGAICRRAKVERPKKPGAPHSHEDSEREMAFDEFQVIWMRKDPPIDDAFTLTTHLLDRHDKSKTLMMNDPVGIRTADEKLWGLFAPELGPETVVSSRPEILRQTVQKFEKAVLKAIGFAGGSGVMVFEADDKNLNAACELLTDGGRKPAVCQRYLKDVRTGDKRVILLGGKPIGALMRIPSSADHRANMHVGGSVAAGVLDEHDIRIADVIGPSLVELGLHFVGIDVIGGRLTEVNVTSPTGVQEIDSLDGRSGKERMSAQVMDYVGSLVPR